MEQRPVLEAFDRALARETHNLLRWPELTWQQLHNELQWHEAGEVTELLAAERDRRRSDRLPPWLRTRAQHGSGSLVRTLEGHEGSVRGCAISADGSFIASAGGDGTVRIWDLWTGKERAVLRGHESSVYACAIARDGTFIVSAGENYELKIWNVETGTVRHTLRGHEAEGGSIGEQAISDCAVAPDGSVISAGGDGTVRVWDPDSGEELAVLRGGGGEMSACAVSSDGTFLVSAEDRPSLLVSAEGEPTVRVWELRRRRFGRSLKAKERTCMERYDVRECAITPDGSLIVLAEGQDKRISVWDLAAGGEPATLDHPDFVHTCAVAPDGSFIAAGGSDKTVRIWDASTREETAALEGHMAPVNDVAVSPDGSLVVSAAADGTVRIWDPAAGSGGVAATHKGGVQEVVFSPDGSFVVSRSFGLGADPATVVSDTLSGRERSRITGPESGDSIEVSSDGAVIASCGGYDVRIWDLTAGRERAVMGYEVEYDYLKHRMGGCAFAPDDSRIVGRLSPPIRFRSEDDPEDRYLMIWDPHTGEEQNTLRGHEAIVYACEFTPDGSRIVSAGADSALKIWDAETAAELATLSGHDGWVLDCAVSPDGAEVVSAGKDNTIRIWDLTTCEERARLTAQGGEIQECAFSPDGTFLVSLSEDGVVRILDAQNGEQQAAIRGEADISSFAIFPTGSLIASVGKEGRDVRIWDTSSGEAVARIPLVAAPWGLAVHPWMPLLAAGDSLGYLNLLDIVGLDPGPIIVTVADRGDGPLLRCPSCFRDHPANPEWHGEVITCPTDGCDLRLRVNPFVIARP